MKVTREEIVEAICTELDRQGLEMDNLGDCESIALQGELPVINMDELADAILKILADKQSQIIQENLRRIVG